MNSDDVFMNLGDSSYCIMIYSRIDRVTVEHQYLEYADKIDAFMDLTVDSGDIFTKLQDLSHCIMQR